MSMFQNLKFYWKCNLGLWPKLQTPETQTYKVSDKKVMTMNYNSVKLVNVSVTRSQTLWNSLNYT